MLPDWLIALTVALIIIAAMLAIAEQWPKTND